MADMLRRFLCCCLPSASHVDENSERAPLLNPDILPEAPPRPQGRSTEEQRRERETLQRILEQATERLISVESLAAFRPVRPESSLSAPSIASSASGSPARRRKKRPTSSSNWRPPMDDTPLAPVRVVQLGGNWEELSSLNGGDPARRAAAQQASVHSMKTLPHAKRLGLVDVLPPSTPRNGSYEVESPDEEEMGAEHEGQAGEADEGDVDEGDSQFGTDASYRTARTRGGTMRESGLRELWNSEGAEGEAISEELSQAVAALEASIDDWSLPGGLGPFVAELGEGNAGNDGGVGKA